jgi:hypothetical protein
LCPLLLLLGWLLCPLLLLRRLLCPLLLLLGWLLCPLLLLLGWLLCPLLLLLGWLLCPLLLLLGWLLCPLLLLLLRRLLCPLLLLGRLLGPLLLLLLPFRLALLLFILRVRRVNRPKKHEQASDTDHSNQLHRTRSPLISLLRVHADNQSAPNNVPLRRPRLWSYAPFHPGGWAELDAWRRRWAGRTGAESAFWSADLASRAVCGAVSQTAVSARLRRLPVRREERPDESGAPSGPGSR